MAGMKRVRFVVGSISATAAAAALASDGCSSNVSNPIVTEGVDSYTIPVQYATTRFGKYVLRTRTYGGRTYGPMVETRPGHQLRMRIVNHLPPNPPAEPSTRPVRIPNPRSMAEAMMGDRVPTQMSASAISKMNNPHDFNTTNLHVHGVQTIPHIFSPLGTSNPAAMMIAIDPGKSFEYPFPIPANHPSGLFWYHPHHHGATDVQISGGMAGLLVIRGPIDEVPEIAAAREIFLVVQTLQVNATPGKRDHFELEPIAYEPPSKGGYNLGTSYVMMTVNGQGVNWQDFTKVTTGTFTQLATPEFSMRPGEVVRLRMLTGTNTLVLPLVLPGMDVFQIGVDGVNFLQPERLAQRGTKLVTPSNLFDGSTIVAASANRNELLIRAPKTPGTFTLSAVANDGISFQAWPKFELARFIVSGSPVQMDIPRSLPTPIREYPLVSPQEVVARRTITFTDGPTNVILTGFAFYINGELYDEMKCSAFPKVGTAEEWTIENHTLMCGHPFHLHDNSVQVFEINGRPVDPVLVCDTILVPPKVNGVPGRVKFRVRFQEFTGKTVYHCHITPHEDTGMMQNILMT
jgi:FtsP/CotA-like multicopper oxidase with cupredoxin domain